MNEFRKAMRLIQRGVNTIMDMFPEDWYENRGTEEVRYPIVQEVIEISPNNSVVELINTNNSVVELIDLTTDDPPMVVIVENSDFVKEKTTDEPLQTEDNTLEVEKRRPVGRPRKRSRLPTRSSKRLAVTKKLRFSPKNMEKIKEVESVTTATATTATAADNSSQIKESNCTVGDLDLCIDFKTAAAAAVAMETMNSDVSDLSMMERYSAAANEAYQGSSFNSTSVKNSTPITCTSYININSDRVKSVSLAVKSVLENHRWYHDSPSPQPGTSKKNDEEEEKKRHIAKLANELATELMSGKYPSMPRTRTPTRKGKHQWENIIFFPPFYINVYSTMEKNGGREDIYIYIKPSHSTSARCTDPAPTWTSVLRVIKVLCNPCSK